MTDFTNKTFRETYRDFYDANDGYYRVLYNSGRALQARELIEQQTIIQEEIARFGQNIFKEGAMVNPGGATVDNGLEYIRLDPVSVFDSASVGDVLTNGEIEFKILEMYDSVDSDPATLYIQYTDTTGVTDTTIAPRVKAADVLSFADGTGGVAMIVGPNTTIPASGKATKAYFAAGDFFVQGHFVYLSGGSAFIDKYNGNPTVDFGFKIEQKIITESEDEDLFDNQGAVPDHTAPGAHRYQIKLTPTTRDQVEDEDNFVFVARIVDGVITREISTFDAYNRINNLLALRTKEESGDYVVDEFKAIFEDLDEDNLNLDVTEGVAYVDGYRLDVGTTDITVPKARDTRETLMEPVPATYGNWVYIDPASTQGVGRIDVFGYVQFRAAGVGPTLGFANVRGVEFDGAGYRLYIFDVKMTIGYSYADVEFFKDPLTGYEIQFDTNYGNHIYGTSDNDLFFHLPKSSPEQNDVLTETLAYTAQVSQTVTATDSGDGVNGQVGPLTGVEYPSWVICEVGGRVLSLTPTGGTYTGDNSAPETTITIGQDYNVLVFTTVTNASPRTKTKVSASVEQSLPDVTWERRPVFLDVLDGVSVESVKVKTSAATLWENAEDITYQWYLDGGQRDNFYDEARAYIKDGYVLPTGTEAEVQVNFTYYEHSPTGKYFSVSSYIDDEYGEIPSHTTATGQVISLRNVLDFRPSRRLGTYTNEFEVVAELPQNTSSIIMNEVNYYLPRVDMLVVNATDSRGDIGFGELQVIQGQPAEQPREPEVPVGSLSLYKFELNAYTFDRSDVISTFIPNKRFTMKDIAKLEDRIENLYELTALSFLETNTNVLEVLDENGNNRTKSGFIADNFSTLNFSDVHNPEYRASVDPEGLLRPSFRESAVRLKYDPTNVSNVVSKKGDIVTLPHTDVLMVSQLLATGTDNINPFAVITQNGFMTLSPSSDEWVEVKSLPDIMQRVVRRINTYLPTFFTRPQNRIRSSVTSKTIQEFIGQRVLNVEIIPFMRSRKINFQIQGLRPNTQMWAFFGNKDVNDWVRQETSYVNFSDDPTEYGSEYANATEYPSALGGKSTLTTDATGELIGSFFLPNTPSLNFRTGRQEFKLLDISLNNEENSTAVGRAGYTSVGTIETVQRTMRTTRIVETTYWRDPLAQTFFVDQVENPNGLFVTKARVFVESKDSIIPMQVQIRPVENGVPTNRVVPGSVKFINPSNIPVTPLTEETDITTVRNNPTIVEFDEPIYLTSGEEYAIVLLAESIEYNVYTAQTYEFVIGPTREARVSRQPTLGSLFMSQNGSTWTPDQTKDLMFELDRAEFDVSGTLLLQNAELPKVTLIADPFETTSGSPSVKVYHEGHGFTHGDTVTLSSSISVGGLTPADLTGSFTVSTPTWEGYTITVASNATGSAVGGGDDVTASQQAMYDQYIPQVQSFSPNSTGLTATSQRAVGASYGSGRSTQPITYNMQNGAVFLNDLNTNDTPRVVATSDNSVKTLELTLNMSTGDPKVSPVIDLQRVSVITLENVIDASDASQHITSPTVIDESSVGLKVIFAANRSQGSDFEVYARTTLDENSLFERDSNGDLIVPWSPITIDTEMPTDENPDTFRDYEYTLNTEPFTVFQVKIVMKATNSSKSPMITDLRALALVV